MTTHIFIDVDGVLNACPWNRPSWLRDWGWGQDYETAVATFERTNLEGVVDRKDQYKIRWSPELVSRLNKLAAREDVVFHWLTTWLDQAPRQLADMIGIDGHDWPVEGIGEYPGRNHIPGWWKAHAIEAVVARLPETDRVVWLDDDMPVGDTRWTWTMGERLLRIKPQLALGLTPTHVDTIEGFVDAC